MAAKRDLIVRMDDDYAHQITFTDEAGDPLDLTGYEFTAELVSSRGVVFAFGVEVIDAAGGVVLLTLTAEQTRTMSPGSARWDLQTVSPSGFRQTWLEGVVTISRDVTRD